MRRTAAMRAQSAPAIRDELLLLRLVLHHPHLLDRHIEDFGHASFISPELEVAQGLLADNGGDKSEEADA